MFGILLASLLGASTWTLLEYLLHRFLFHGPNAAAAGAREHRQHHADPDYFAPWWQKGLAAVAVTGVIAPVAVLVAGAAAGASFTLSFIGMYLLYELLHRRVHTHPPRGPYGRWRRRNHLAHHFRDPKRGHGVTVPFWDAVFGTRLESDRVQIPRRLATRWLVDDEGELREAFAADYELVGGRSRSGESTREDRDAAMVNRPPRMEPV